MKQGGMRTFLYGLLIWVVPFIVASAVWDPLTNSPRMSQEMFSGIMGAAWAITFSIAALGYFKPINKITKSEAWKVAFTWYLTVIVLEFVFIVLVFGNPFSNFAHLILVNLPTLLTTGVIGTLLSKR